MGNLGIMNLIERPRPSDDEVRISVDISSNGPGAVYHIRITRSDGSVEVIAGIADSGHIDISTSAMSHRNQHRTYYSTQKD